MFGSTLGFKAKLDIGIELFFPFEKFETVEGLTVKLKSIV
jgi:hypothetical protein